MTDSDKTNKQAEVLSKVENPSKELDAEDVIKYLSFYVDKNPAEQQEAIDLISQRTDYNKKTAREILENQKSEKGLDNFEIEKIVKIEPINEEDDSVYEFHIEYNEEYHSFRIESSELVTSQEFKKKILELTDNLLTFDSWKDRLNKWMDSSNLEVREEEPLKDAHAVVEHIFDQFEMLQPTEEMAEFKKYPEAMAFIDDVEKEILVSGRWIDNKVETMNKDVSNRKVRSLLDEFMPDGDAKKVRVDDDLFRAWRFNKEKLSKIGVLDTLEGEEQ